MCTRKSQLDKQFVHWPERQKYEYSRQARYKVEALFAELKQQIRLRRVRLRRLWSVTEQFHLAATAQNLKRLAHHLARKQSPVQEPKYRKGEVIA
jgi:hypothetical protein